MLALYLLFSPEKGLILEIRSYDCSRCGGRPALVRMLSTCFFGVDRVCGCMDKVCVIKKYNANLKFLGILRLP